MAGRMVLINFVILALPSYYMQTMLLPKCIIKELEKVSRDFLWNQNQEGKKMHLIAWDQIKQNKEAGGLGIKDLQTQNVAFIMKLCWGILTKPNDLWVKCLKGKYGCGDGDYPVVCKKQNSSSVWRSITSVWEKFSLGVGRILRSGNNTHVWWDLWTPLDEPLIHFVEGNFHIINPCAKVKEFVLPNGEWDIAKWRRFLPEWVINIITSGMPPCDNGDDLFSWRNASDGTFSVRSAYKFLSIQKERSALTLWKKVWKLQAPEKIKMFMWQVIHERLPTNSLRARRDPSVSIDCPFECQREETILHILRDCEIARDVWLHFVPINLRARFFSSYNLQVWLTENMSRHLGKLYFKKWAWIKIFSIICWLLWKNRCKGVMEGV